MPYHRRGDAAFPPASRHRWHDVTPSAPRGAGGVGCRHGHGGGAPGRRLGSWALCSRSSTSWASGSCRTRRAAPRRGEAVLTAKLAREAFGTDWVKLEVIGDDRTLLPDAVELLAAAEQLTEDGFVVLPYTTDDPVLARRLQQVGCAAVMPLGSPIGSGRGHAQSPQHFALCAKRWRCPSSSMPALARHRTRRWPWSWAATACWSPPRSTGLTIRPPWPGAMRLAVESGYLARRAGRIPVRFHAEPSSPDEGRLDFGGVATP